MVDRQARFIIGLTLAAIGSGACAGQISDVVEYATVTVDATLLSGEPVAGIHLDLYIGSRIMAIGETDEAGRHVFEFVPPNVYGVYAGPPPIGYVRPEQPLGGPTTTYVDGLVIEEGDRKSVTFTYLRCVASIRALVVDGVGAPLAGASVALFTAEEELIRRETEASGAVVFTELPCGIVGYGVRVIPPEGYTVEEGRGSSFFDGLEPSDGEELVVTFRVDRT